jgi:hypothetical protein
MTQLSSNDRRPLHAARRRSAHRRRAVRMRLARVVGEMPLHARWRGVCSPLQCREQRLDVARYFMLHPVECAVAGAVIQLQGIAELVRSLGNGRPRRRGRRAGEQLPRDVGLSGRQIVRFRICGEVDAGETSTSPVGEAHPVGVHRCDTSAVVSAPSPSPRPSRP